MSYKKEYFLKFQEWFDEWAGPQGPINEKSNYKEYINYRPKDLEKWFYSSWKRKKEIRKLIGGKIAKEIIVQNDEIDSSIDIENYYIKSILENCIPGYLDEYNFTKQVFAKRKIEGTGTKFDGMILSNHITTYANKKKIDTYYLNSHLRYLGDIWKANEIKEGEKHYLLLTTNPKAFIMLGHYGLDTDSCFAHPRKITSSANSTMNCDKKFTLCEYPNSFILLKSDKPFNENALDGKDIRARCCGIYDPKDHSLSFFNRYPFKGNDGELKDFDYKVVYQRLIRDKKIKFKTITNKITLKGGINYIANESKIISDKIDPEKIFNFTTKYSKESHTSSDYYANW